MPERLIATIWLTDSTETSRTLRFGVLMPALLIRMSMCPCWRWIAAAASATSFWSATSTAIASPLPAALSCFSAPARVDLLLPEITTCAPARASSIAPASPIPEPPPVIQATFPLSAISLGIGVFLFLVFGSFTLLICPLPLLVLSRAEQDFGLLLVEARCRPAPVREHLDRLLHRRAAGDALAPLLQVRKVVDVHALALGRAQPREGG